MTHPTHQKKGLSKKINELLIEKTKELKTPFSYTLCSKISTKSFIKNKWIFIEEVINFFKPYVLLKATVIFKKTDLKAFHVYNAIENHLDEYKFNEDSTKIAVQKNARYLQWRTSNPNFTYKVICSYNNEKKINGYLIYSISVNKLLNVIDMECDTSNKVIRSQLLNYAEYIVVKEKLKGILVMTIKNSPFYNFIKSKKYLSNPFSKGPLKTILDFDIYIFDKNKISINNTIHWDFYGLSYDDI